MRLVVDMQGAQTGSRFRGIGRYTLSIIKALAQHPFFQKRENELVLVLNGMLSDSLQDVYVALEGDVSREQMFVWYGCSPCDAYDPDNDERRLCNVVLKEALIARLQPDAVLVTSFFEGFHDNAVTELSENFPWPVVAIFYDLIPLLRPDEYLTPGSRHEFLYMQKVGALKKAELLLAISEASRIEAIEHLGVEPHRVVNISAAMDEAFESKASVALDEIKGAEDFCINDPFILYTGASDPRKNLSRLIDAYGCLPEVLQRQYQLVIAGAMPEDNRVRFENQIKKQGVDLERVVFTGRITDEWLVKLYRSCHLFVFPSLHEGFGLPVLEAMACGAPVIGSNVTSVPEVIGWESALFDPMNVEQMAAMINRGLTDTDFRDALKVHGVRQVEKFSWERSAEAAVDALENRFGVLSGVGPEGGLENFSDCFGRLKTRDLTGFSEKNFIQLAYACNAASKVGGARPQLLLDVSGVVETNAQSGIQRVVLSLLKAFFAMSEREGLLVRPVYALWDATGYFYADTFCYEQLGIDTGEQERDQPLDVRPGDVFVALDLNPILMTYQLPLLKRYRDRGVKVWHVVYDLLPKRFPEFFDALVVDRFLDWLDLTSQFDGVVCISESVASEYAQWLAHERRSEYVSRSFSIEWFHLGSDLDKACVYSGEGRSAMTLAFDQGRESVRFLMVGTLEPRKAYAQALSAFEALWQKGVDVSLSIVGHSGWLVESLAKRIDNHPEKDKRLFWYDQAGDELLQGLYEQCDCLLAASYGEGFGLPLIEAAQYGLPIVARDIPVFREVAGKGAFYFDDSDDSLVLAEAVIHWMALFKTNAYPRSDLIKKLTWEESAKQFLGVLGIAETKVS
ncbi:MAG: glycosyltransferase family 1 protein [Hydrogenovibrio sp.]|uniref:glycosyltransferase family 4 protein n=1 Tax=Hydrogenovibrio sp. TaxID=2065821 RepID=UPI00286FB79E|nr:glycosyltransferase family 1 protein [Hydrogenovibrio sp.]MDR9499960.1 glycosyltransferase family 1 protein [Hydrogenovibrio sp.]